METIGYIHNLEVTSIPPDSDSSGFGYGYGAAPGQIGVDFGSLMSFNNLYIAEDDPKKIILTQFTQNVRDGSPDGIHYYHAFDGTGGEGFVNADGTINDPNNYTEVRLSFGVTLNHEYQVLTFVANDDDGSLKIFEGDVDDADVDFFLSFGSQSATFSNGDQVVVSFDPVSLASNPESQLLEATLTLIKAKPEEPKPVDWNAMAEAVTRHWEQTGQWVSYENLPKTPPETPPENPPAQGTDWDAIAALVTAHWEQTGQWVSYDQLI